MQSLLCAALLLLLLFVGIAVVRAQEPVPWRLLGAEVDSEALDRINLSGAGSSNSVVWKQPFARCREVTTYWSTGDNKPYLLFNGGGFTSIYRYGPTEDRIQILVDGSREDGTAITKSFGRMATIPDQDLLLVANLVKFQVEVYRLSTGEWLRSHVLWSTNGTRPSGMTYLAIKGTTHQKNHTLTLPLTLYVWNQGAQQIRTITGLDQGLWVEQDTLQGSALDIGRLGDIIPDPAGNLHLLYPTLCKGKVLWKESGQIEERFNLNGVLPSGNGYCHQMDLHLETLTYLVTVPSHDRIAVVDARTGQLQASLSTQRKEAFSITTSGWNEDLLLFGGGSSLFGSDVRTVIESVKRSNTRKKRISLIEDHPWKDILQNGDLPVPDLSRVLQQPAVLGGSLYSVAGTNGYVIAASAQSDQTDEYHLIKVDAYGDLFTSIDSIAYLPNTHCEQTPSTRAPQRRQTHARMFMSGLTKDVLGGPVDNVIYDMTSVPKHILFSTGDARVRVTSLDHHPLEAVLAAGLSNGSLVIIHTDTSANHLPIAPSVVQQADGAGSRISWVAWDCQQGQRLYVADAGKNRLQTFHFSAVTNTLVRVGGLEAFDSPRQILSHPTRPDVRFVTSSKDLDKLFWLDSTLSTIQNVTTLQQRFATLVFQHLPSTKRIVQPTLERHRSSNIPSETWFALTDAGTGIYRSEFDAASYAAIASGPSGNNQQTPDPDQVARSAANDGETSLSASMAYPFLAVVLIVLVFGLIVMAYTTYQRITEHRHRETWASRAGKPTIIDQSAVLRRWSATTFAYRGDPDKGKSRLLNDELTIEELQQPDVLQKVARLPKSPDEEDEEMAIGKQALRPVTTTNQQIPDQDLAGLTRFVKMILPSNWLRATPLPPTAAASASTNTGPSSQPSSGKTSPQVRAADQLGVRYNLIDMPPSVQYTRNQPIRLRVFQAHSPRWKGEKANSGGSSSPVQVRHPGTPPDMPTPPRYHSPRRVPTQHEAAHSYHKRTEESASTEQQVLVVDEKTGELHEEIDLKTSNSNASAESLQNQVDSFRREERRPSFMARMWTAVTFPIRKKS